MKVIIFIVAFLAIVSASKYTEFAQIAKSDFGRTLLETIQLQLKSKAPVETLTNLLNDMLAQLVQQQADADATHGDYQAQCADNQATYQANIDAAQNNVDQANNDIATLTPQISDNTQVIADLQAQVGTWSDQILLLGNQREEEAEAFTQKIQDHDDAQTAINEAKKLIASLLSNGGSSFLQTNKQVFVQVQKHFQKSKTENRSKFYKSLFTLLASIASRAKEVDQEIVAKIVNLCDQILDNIANSRAVETAAEQARIEQYESDISSLNSNIEEANNNIDQTTALVASLNNQLNLAQQSLADNTDSFNTNTELLAEENQKCADEEASYATAAAQNADEQNIVNQVLVIVKTRLSNLSDYLNNQISGADQ